jgi:hypothetical protein
MHERFVSSIDRCWPKASITFAPKPTPLAQLLGSGSPKDGSVPVFAKVAYRARSPREILRGQGGRLPSYKADENPFRRRNEQREGKTAWPAGSAPFLSDTRQARPNKRDLYRVASVRRLSDLQSD